MSQRKPAWLRDLTFSRVDLVGKGANQDGSLEGSHVVLFKSADSSAPKWAQALLGNIQTLLSKSRSPEGRNMPKKTSELTLEEALSKIEEVQTELTAKGAEVDTLTQSVTDLEKAAHSDDDDDDEKKKREDAKKLSAVPAEVQKILDEQSEQVRKADERTERIEKQLAEEVELRLVKQYTEQAGELPFIQGEVEEIAKKLRAIDGIEDEEARKGIRDMLTQANTLLGQSALFTKFSKAPIETSAAGQIEKLAKVLMEEDPEQFPTIEQARTRVYKTHKELALDIRNDSSQ